MASKMQTFTNGVNATTFRTLMRGPFWIYKSNRYSNAFSLIGSKRLEFLESPSGMVASLSSFDFGSIANVSKFFKNKNSIGNFLNYSKQIFGNLMVNIFLKSTNFTRKFLKMSFCRFCSLGLKLAFEIVVSMFNMQNLFIIKKFIIRSYSNSFNSQINSYRIYTFLNLRGFLFKAKVKIKDIFSSIIAKVRFCNLPITIQQFIKQIRVSGNNLSRCPTFKGCKRYIWVVKAKITRIIQSYGTMLAELRDRFSFICFKRFNNFPDRCYSKLRWKIKSLANIIVGFFVKGIATIDFIINSNFNQIITSGRVNE